MAFEDTPANPLTPQEEAELHRLLNDLPVGEPPADLTARIMAAVAAEEAEARVIELPKRKPAFRWRSLVSLAAVLAFALMGTWSLQQGQGNVLLSSPAQEESELAPYSAEQQGRSVTASEVLDESDAAENNIAVAELQPQSQAVSNGSLPVADTELTPDAALELLLRDWFEASTAYDLTATQTDTDPLTCRLRFTDGDRTVSEGTLTYLETTDNGYRFEWDEDGEAPLLFTVSLAGDITLERIEAPAE